jgi:hypothetical protein
VSHQEKKRSNEVENETLYKCLIFIKHGSHKNIFNKRQFFEYIIFQINDSFYY